MGFPSHSTKASPLGSQDPIGRDIYVTPIGFPSQSAEVGLWRSLDPMGRHRSMSPCGFPGCSAGTLRLREPGSLNILLWVPLVAQNSVQT